MRESSRVEYQTRIHRVLGYIEDHVADDLALDQLARAACLSPFHFHRVFKSMTGESVNAFVQRRRLERAARELQANRGATILEVASAYGYENAAAFSRAFRRCFGVTATEWRQAGAEARRALLFGEKKRTRDKDSKNGTDINLPVWQKLACLESNASTDPGEMKPHTARVEELPQVHAVGMHYTGPYGSSKITKVWDRLMARADKLGVVHAGTECVGIVHDDPAITDPGRCRYDACVVVPKGTTDVGLSSLVVGGGEFLVFAFVGSPSDVDPAWDAVYAHLPDSGYQPANRPNLEWYPPQSILDPVKMLFRCKMCVPVRRL
jgi:AraC family transcriptional regulator